MEIGMICNQDICKTAEKLEILSLSAYSTPIVTAPRIAALDYIKLADFAHKSVSNDVAAYFIEQAYMAFDQNT